MSCMERFKIRQQFFLALCAKNAKGCPVQSWQRQKFRPVAIIGVLSEFVYDYMIICHGTSLASFHACLFVRQLCCHSMPLISFMQQAYMLFQIASPYVWLPQQAIVLFPPNFDDLHPIGVFIDSDIPPSGG